MWFNVLGDTVTIDNDEVLDNIVCSLENIVFINRDQPFESLIKHQQKHYKHILVDFVPKPFNECHYMVSAINNFLAATSQNQSFMLDRIVINDGDGLTLFGTEYLRENISATTTFSPTIRSYWVDSLTIEKILIR